MAGMKKMVVIGAVLVLLLTGAAIGQRDKDDAPTAWVNFVVVKDDNGKPVRNAAVIMHPVEKGKQQHGGMELKTDADGRANFDGAPYGPLRIQVLAQGFQTYGEDFEIDKPKMEFTIKLKRPQTQYSVYDDHAKDAPPPKPDAPPPAPDKKPN
jgi:Carboxypeptidase regulatory-like domain